MAKKPGSGSGGGTPPLRGQLTREQVKLLLRREVYQEVDRLKREKDFDLVIQGKATGVGNFEAFKKEVEKQFTNSSPRRVMTQAKKDLQEGVKPVLTKVSVEVPRRKKKRKP